MEAYYFKHVLKFKSPSGTSRGILKTKDSWFIVIRDQDRIGVGECSLIEGLSPDPIQTFEKTLNEVCKNIKFVLIISMKNYPLTPLYCLVLKLLIYL